MGGDGHVSSLPALSTILVVDDSPENLTVLSALLRPDYRVRVATEGRRALGIVESDDPPDLVLLDVMMPGMSGFEVCAKIRANPARRDIPIIFVTALGEVEDERHGLELGAIDYVTKPISPAIVSARVKNHLELKHARAALARQNAWLEGEVQRRTRENELIQDVSLSVIAGLVETRDLETGNHTMRTQAYVEALAQRMRQAPRYADELADVPLARLVKAAPLHDIGKIGIPDGILLKPGPLTRDEFEIMKSHSRIGGTAIARAIERVTCLPGADAPPPPALAFLEVARQIALWHHERWNGTGYPDQLAGEQIPLCARLMAVADVFDALTTKRVYKAPMPTGQAIQLILDGRGTQFDPSAVDAFAGAAEDFAAIAHRYADSGP